MVWPVMVWRRVCEGRDYRCTRKVVKFGGGGVMVWGAIARDRKFPLVRIRGTLNADQYIIQVLCPFLPCLPRATRKRLVFMQDSASCHTAAATTHFLRENNVDVYEYWPSNSPDLNPIENIEHKLKKRICTSDNELYEQICGMLYLFLFYTLCMTACQNVFVLSEKDTAKQ